MSEATTQISKRREQNSEINRTIANLFFTQYHNADALSKSSKKPGEAIKFFHNSKGRLDKELHQLYRDRSALNSSKLDKISVCHALLSLVHWLYPNYIGYNRLSNARLMHRHSAAAMATSRSETSITYAIGLIVQLRITPFLIRSRKSTVETLSRLRLAAREFSSSGDFDGTDTSWIPGMAFDALGFSYFLFERDIDKAEPYLTQASICFSTNKEKLLERLSNRRNNEAGVDKVRLSFFRAIGSAALWDLGICYEGKAEKAEGDEMLKFIKQARVQYHASLNYSSHTSWNIYRAMSSYNLSGTYFREGMNQVEKKKAIKNLERSVSLGEESLRWFRLWSIYESDFLGGSWIAAFYQHLANFEGRSEKKKLMTRSIELAKRAETLVNNKKVGLARYKIANLGDIFYQNSEYYRQLAIERKLASIHSSRDESKVAELLRTSLSNCLKSRVFYSDAAFVNRKIDSSLLAGDICYDLMNCSWIDEKERRKYSGISKKHFRDAIRISGDLRLNEKIASSHWRLAQVLDKEGKFSQSAASYSDAHEAYESASLSPENATIYSEPSSYMKAWCDIENAKVAHRLSDFEKAAELYGRASGIIRSTHRWQSRSQFYGAESMIEEAERESLRDNTGLSIDRFEKAIRILTDLQSKLKDDFSLEAKSFSIVGSQLKAFCSARVILEKSKESYRIGATRKSIRGLSQAGHIFSNLAKEFSVSDVQLSNELSSLASLSMALRSLQIAQVEGDSNMYLEARQIFEKAAAESSSSGLKSLHSGLAGFANFLYSSKEIEDSLESGLDIEQLVECDKALGSAEGHFTKLGNKSFLAMLRASKHILDATIKINAAERELENSEVKAKLFRGAQRSLSLASKYYERLGSSARLKESLRMISTVRQNKELIPIARDIIAEVASSQGVYAAISNSSLFEKSPENSARELDSAFVVTDLKVQNPVAILQDSIAFTLTISNIGSESAFAVKFNGVLPEGFQLLDRKYPLSRDNSLPIPMKIEPGSSKNFMFSMKSSSIGEFVWNPSLVYMDEKRRYRITKPQTGLVVIEPTELVDIPLLSKKKEKLQAQLKLVDSTKQSEEFYSLREEISKIEENIARSMNEYEKLNSRLEQVRADLKAIDLLQNDALNIDEKKKLQNEEIILRDRIERRRSIFLQINQS
ncbi:MAG: hypothetical protein OK439_00675 [Thaumarchaeota archaeon]|nr:hypothetical protein [Nitrososphaerota archaeon]